MSAQYKEKLSFRLYLEGWQWDITQIRHSVLKFTVVQSSHVMTRSIRTTPDCANTWKPRQNGLHFADNTFKRISLNENVRISIQISPNFVP